jgi:hypothetical protein
LGLRSVEVHLKASEMHQPATDVGSLRAHLQESFTYDYAILALNNITARGCSFRILYFSQKGIHKMSTQSPS